MHWFWRATIAALLGFTVFVAAWGLLETHLHPITMEQFLRQALLSPTALFTLVLAAAPIAFYVALTQRFGPRAKEAKETRCRKCGYILRGITEPRCPECGERI